MLNRKNHPHLGRFWAGLGVGWGRFLTFLGSELPYFRGVMFVFRHRFQHLGSETR